MVMQFIRGLIRRYYSHEVGRSAAALTYYLLFSFFPFLVFISALLSMLNIPRSSLYAQLSVLMPSEVVGIIDSFLESTGEVNAKTLMVFGIVFMIYFPVRAMSWLIHCIYDFSDGDEHRSGIHQAAVVLLFSVSIPVVILISVSIVIMGENILTMISKYISLSVSGIRLWSWLRFLLLAGIIFLVLCLLYSLAPKGRMRFSQVFPGAMAATLAWLIISLVFSYYVQNIRNYSIIYGSLGAIMVLLLWLYFASMMMLMGAEFNQTLMDVRGRK